MVYWRVLSVVLSVSLLADWRMKEWTVKKWKQNALAGLVLSRSCKSVVVAIDVVDATEVEQVCPHAVATTLVSVSSTQQQLPKFPFSC